jgi:hypothetical protein
MSTLEEVHRHARSASSRCCAAFSLSTTLSSRVTASAAAGGEDDTHTRVIYRLEPEGGGTRVFFEQSGFESERAFKGAEYGWTFMHGKRAKVLQAMAAPR